MTSINTNIGAIKAQANMARVNEEFSTSMSRLSSGMRINAASDDAAGMAIAEKMTAQINGLNQAVRNATDGKSLVDTTEGAHVEVSNMLQRLRELAVQSANDTNTDADRGSLAAETSQLINEINRVSKDTTFNGMNILDGSFTGKQFQIGADSGQVMKFDVDSAAATDIGAHTLRTEAAVTAGAGTTDSGIQAGTVLNITGPDGSATVTQTAGQDASDLAKAINSNSAATGVSASATSTARLSSFSGADTVTFDVNGVSIGNVNIADASDLRGLRDAINAKSGQTGVTASMGDNNAEIMLSDSTGKDITITGFTTGTAGSTMDLNAVDYDGTNLAGATQTATLDDTDNAGVVTGQVEITSTKSFSVGASGTTPAAGTDFFGAATASSSDLESVSEIDLTTADGASRAIKVIDVALSKVSDARSELGAISNRLDSTISNLTNISVNVQSAKSNIVDADFAKESTSLARGQILSQAATAMLAQANSSQQNVLSLLRG